MSDLAGITHDAIAEYLACLRVDHCASTYNNRVCVFREIFHILAAKAGIDEDPWEGVKLRPDDSHSRRELTVDELKRLWKKPRRVLFIRRPSEKKVEPVCLNRRERKRTKSPKDGIVVPVASARPKQEEFEFVTDCKGREWDYCALVTNDEKRCFTQIQNHLIKQGSTDVFRLK